MKSRHPNRPADKNSPDSRGKHRSHFHRDGTSKSHRSSSDSESSPAEGHLKKDSTEKSNAEKEPFDSNPYHRPDKFAEDYQDRHRRATIWNQGHEKFLSDSPSGESGAKKPVAGKRDFRESRSGRSNQTQESDRNSRNHFDSSQKRSKKSGSPPGTHRGHSSSDASSQKISDKTPGSRLPSISADDRSGKPVKSMGDESLSSAKGRYGEPITLAEDIALVGDFPKKELVADSPETSAILEELNRMTTAELVDLARKENLTTGKNENRAELIITFLRQRVRQSGFMFGEGTLEILPDSFGFLRSATHRYLSGPDDIYVSPSQIRRFGLRNGLMISGQIRPPKERERYFALLRIETINHNIPQSLRKNSYFEDMQTIAPHQHLYFRGEPVESHLPDNNADNSTNEEKSLSSLFGSYLEVEVPESPGSESVMNDWVKTIRKNHPDCYILCLSFLETTNGSPDELSSPFQAEEGESIIVKSDEPPAVQIHIVHLFLEKAKRMVEFGQHVILLIHSVTHLIQAWNDIGQEKGESSEELKKRIVARRKMLTACPRQIDQGGSLTIITTKK